MKVTARLQHPNIVQVLDFDRLADGTPFMVMERLRGRTLRAALRETRRAGRSGLPRTRTRWRRRWPRASTAPTRTASIVHRDIKPENIYLHRPEGSFDSVVKVMDFGVAAVVGRARSADHRHAAVHGARAGVRRAVSPQTDQYALALVIYEMLTGRLPWEVDVRDVKALAEAHRRAVPAPPSQFCPWLPGRIDTAVLKALSKDPGARHDTLHGLMFELRGLQWIGDRPGAAGDANTTDPMVGTLAEGGAAIREDEDPFGRLPPPHTDGPAPDVPGPSAAFEISVELSGSWEPTTLPLPEAQSPPAKRPIAAGARAGAPEDRGLMATDALDTPMTGESRAGAASQGGGPVSRRNVGRMAAALAGALALIALLANARMARSPREPGPQDVQPLGRRAWGAATGLSSSELGVQPPRSILEAPSAVAVAVVTPTLDASAEPAVANGASARADGGPGGPAERRATVPLRPAPRIAPAKASVPDDGRDELYVPGTP